MKALAASAKEASALPFGSVKMPANCSFYSRETGWVWTMERSDLLHVPGTITVRPLALTSTSEMASCSIGGKTWFPAGANGVCHDQDASKPENNWTWISSVFQPRSQDHLPLSNGNRIIGGRDDQTDGPVVYNRADGEFGAIDETVGHMNSSACPEDTYWTKCDKEEVDCSAVVACEAGKPDPLNNIHTDSHGAALPE
jgi:hypothetical protein